MPHVLPETWNEALPLATETLDAAAVPLLVTVTVCLALVDPTLRLPNDRDAGFADMDADCATPVPERATLIVAPPPVMVYVALSVCAAVGEYVNVTVQDAPALSVALPHVPPLLNFAGAAAYDMLVAAAVPVFDTVMTCAPLVEPVATLPNASDSGAAETLGCAADWPVPEKETATVVAPVPKV
jgi:hypothetical protein